MVMVLSKQQYEAGHESDWNYPLPPFHPPNFISPLPRSLQYLLNQSVYQSNISLKWKYCYKSFSVAQLMLSIWVGFGNMENNIKV